LLDVTPADPDVTIEEISSEAALRLLKDQGSWRQYPAYAAVAAERIHGTSRYFACVKDSLAISAFNLRSRALPLGLGYSSLVSHGPVLLRDDALQATDLDDTIRALQRFAKANKHEIRIDPDPLLPLPYGGAKMERAGVAAGYRTIVLPLEEGERALRAKLHPKWRASLKSAERAGLEVRRSGRGEDIMRIHPLLDALMSRKGFAINQGPEFFAEVARRAEGSERILCHMVCKGDQLLSVHVGAYSGQTATYLLGATSDAGRPLHAAYLAQWHAILTAIELGFTGYDTGGTDPVGNPDVYRFKQRMGGTEIATSGVIVISPGGLRGPLLATVRRAWELVRR